MVTDIKERQKIDFTSGNTIRVWQKIKEGDKTRLQAFEGVIIAHKHGLEPGATIIVRKVVDGIGVERTFPIFSPVVDKMEVVKKAKTRRAKLYYIREKAAKEIRRKMKQARAEKTKKETENIETEEFSKEENKSE